MKTLKTLLLSAFLIIGTGAWFPALSGAAVQDVARSADTANSANSASPAISANSASPAVSPDPAGSADSGLSLSGLSGTQALAFPHLEEGQSISISGLSAVQNIFINGSEKNRTLSISGLTGKEGFWISDFSGGSGGQKIYLMDLKESRAFWVTTMEGALLLTFTYEDGVFSILGLKEGQTLSISGLTETQSLSISGLEPSQSLYITGLVVEQSIFISGLKESQEVASVCFVENGSGLANWDATAQNWLWQNCRVATCDAGYYENPQGGNLCLKVEEGYYSSAKDKQKHRCADKPLNSHWVGIKYKRYIGPEDCEWACSAGYDDETVAGVCLLTEIGYYSPSNDNRRYSCGNLPEHANWVATQGGASSGDCQWACSAGYDDEAGEGVCLLTETGYYSPGNDSRRYSCGNLPEHANWVATQGGASSGDCQWACSAGYDDEAGEGVCLLTEPGYYSPAHDSRRYSCGNLPEHANWACNPRSCQQNG